MVGLRSLILLLIGGSLGCTGLVKQAHSSLDQVAHSVQSAVGLSEPEPVMEFDCVWMNRLQLLADPGREHRMMPGLVGQAFFFDKRYDFAPPLGELTISVADATKRPAGTPPAPTEVYHFTGDVLQKLIVHDERYGWSVALFLPWPEEWHDVNVLTIQARYDQKQVPNAVSPLVGRLTTLTLDFSQAPGASAGGAMPITHKRYLPVPDPEQTLSALKSTQPVSRAWVEPTSAPVKPPSVQSSSMDEQRSMAGRSGSTIPMPRQSSSPETEFRTVIPRR